jgi:hypothetical protein
MDKPSRPSNLSKKLLLGVVVAATPLAGCDLISQIQQQPLSNELASVSAPANERSAFDMAVASRSPADAEAFLRNYPDSELVRTLLTRLPVPTLQRIDDDAVALVSPTVLNLLPFHVRQALGLIAPSSNDRSSSSSGSDGYSG